MLFSISPLIRIPSLALPFSTSNTSIPSHVLKGSKESILTGISSGCIFPSSIFSSFLFIFLLEMGCAYFSQKYNNKNDSHKKSFIDSTKHLISTFPILFYCLKYPYFHRKNKNYLCHNQFR